MAGMYGTHYRRAALGSLLTIFACDQPAPSDPGATLQALNSGLMFISEAQLDTILDGLEGRTYTLVLRRRDAADPTRPGGIDPAASNLHAQILGHAPGDITATADATATVPRLCAQLTTTINTLGNAVAPTPLGRALVALAVCRGLDRTIDGMLASGGDLDRFLEREVAPHMRGSRAKGDCKGYTIAAAALEFQIQGVDLTPDGSETRLAMRIEDPTLRVTEGTYQVGDGSEKNDDGPGRTKVCADRSLVGARLAIDGRLDLGFRARASETSESFPWPELCGKPIVASMPPPAEAATVPRKLLHGQWTIDLDTRATISHIDLDSQGLFVDWAVQYFLNHTKQIACAFAGVSEDQCERGTEAARTVPVASYKLILPTWGAVLEHLRWDTINSAPRLRFDSRAGLDPDHDLLLTGLDNCPNNANVDQADVDYDGVGDACDPVTGDPDAIHAAILQQTLVNCRLGTMSETFDPLRSYPRLDRNLAMPRIEGVKQYWKLQAKDYGFDWSMVIIDEKPERMFASVQQAMDMARFNLDILATRWNRPELRLIPLNLVKVGANQRVGYDAAKLPMLTSYQRTMLELAIPDRLIP